jgi:hypothetical protein
MFRSKALKNIRMSSAALQNALTVLSAWVSVTVYSPFQFTLRKRNVSLRANYILHVALFVVRFEDGEGDRKEKEVSNM